MKNDLVELRKQAEESVIDMPEGDLKVKAFETILTHLLSRNTGNGGVPSSSGTTTHTKKQPKQKDAVPDVPKSSGDRILFLKTDGFFASQKSIAEIRLELKKNGWHYPVTSLSGPLQSLVRRRQLRREQANDEEGRKGWKYSNP